MEGHHHLLSYLWIALGIILAFYAWSFVYPSIAGVVPQA